MKEFLLKRYPMTRLPLARSVMASSTQLRHGERISWHQHHHGQLVFAVRGVVRALTPQHTWTLPPSRALWLPSDVDHELHAVGALKLCNVHIEPELFAWQWSEPLALSASPLLRELALNLSAGGEDYAPTSQAALSAPLLLKVIADAATMPQSGVPLPHDERLLKICEHLMNDPGSDTSLDFWAARMGASGRTFARRFKDETGMTFGVWRQHMRVDEAISRLTLGQPVARVAGELGYSSASAFIVMFRQITGSAPQQYLSA
ncbi:HTH-type transcriptional repressor of iron proteins A [Burkholderia sp. AD24]|nr:HTH-type transcriptional repressor of iron proteins A [Burkholderia sp. AD24]